MLVIVYIRGSGAPECIFHNNHKTLYINLLTLTQLFPLLLTRRFHIVKYTSVVVFCCISFRSMSFLFQPRMRSDGTNDFISSIFMGNYLGNISLLSYFLQWRSQNTELVTHIQGRLLDQAMVLFTCADPGIFVRGGGGQVSLTKKALTTFFFRFFFSPQLILQKSNGQFQRNLSFFKVPEGVQQFPGGGVQLFPGRGPIAYFLYKPI